MAIWQFPVQLVPLQWAEENNYCTDDLYGEDGFDTSSTWSQYQLTVDLESIFGVILAKAEPWSIHQTVWGNDKQHDICAWQRNGTVSSIGFRLDLRDNFVALLEPLVTATNKLNCVMFIPGQKVLFKPNVFELKKYILNSRSSKFVKDPEGFLAGLHDSD